MPCSSSCSHQRPQALRPQALRHPGLRPSSRAATPSSSVAARHVQKCPLGACASSGSALDISVLSGSRPPGVPSAIAEPSAIATNSTTFDHQEATLRKPSLSPCRSQARSSGAARRRPTIRRNGEPALSGTASSRSSVQGLAPHHRLRRRHRRRSPASATRRAGTAPCATTGAGSACTTTSGAGFARAGGRRARAASTRGRGRLTTRSLQTAST